MLVGIAAMREGVDALHNEVISDSTNRAPGFVDNRSDGVASTKVDAIRRTVSIVIPVFNESAVLPELFRRLKVVCDMLVDFDWQVIFVDDGSTDATQALVSAQNKCDRRFALVALSRNFGHQAAISAGLDHARGDAVVTMDADLQDPPELIAQFLDRWKEGYQIVYAVRKTRKEGPVLRLAYAGFYRLMRFLARIEIPLDAGDFCLMDAQVVREISALPERNRFLRGLRAWVGFKQTGQFYDRPARFAGETKYSWFKLLHLAVSGLVAFSDIPLRLATWLGFAASMCGFALLIWVFATRYAGLVGPHGWTSLIAVVLFMSGIQLLILGIIGEYLAVIDREVRHRPVYIVGRRLGLEAVHTDVRRAE
jgi:dolichol-phosphate mannosyltransferase